MTETRKYKIAYTAAAAIAAVGIPAAFWLGIKVARDFGFCLC